MQSTPIRVPTYIVLSQATSTCIVLETTPGFVTQIFYHLVLNSTSSVFALSLPLATRVSACFFAPLVLHHLAAGSDLAMRSLILLRHKKSVIFVFCLSQRCISALPPAPALGWGCSGT